MRALKTLLFSISAGTLAPLPAEYGPLLLEPRHKHHSKHLKPHPNQWPHAWMGSYAANNSQCAGPPLEGDDRLNLTMDADGEYPHYTNFTRRQSKTGYVSHHKLSSYG